MKKMLALLTAMMLLLSACSSATADGAGKEVEDTITNITDADNKYVKMVKGGYRADAPEWTYDDAFTAFFGTPRWKYFESDDGQDVVEFTGDCTYQDVPVKARIQFVVDEENGTFEATYLAFNEVPQDALTLAALIERAFEEVEPTEEETEEMTNIRSHPPEGTVVFDNDGTPWVVSENGEFCFVNGSVCTDPTDNDGNYIDEGWFSVDWYSGDGNNRNNPPPEGSIVFDNDGTPWVVSENGEFCFVNGSVCTDPTDSDGNYIDEGWFSVDWCTGNNGNGNLVTPQMAYRGKVNELAMSDATLQFDLIDLTGNEMPELVAGHPGYYVSVFMWADGDVVTVMDNWPYGASGNHGYEYLPGQNVIRNFNSDMAGAIEYESYMRVNSAHEIENLDSLCVYYFQDKNGNGYADEDEYSFDNPVYYYGGTEVSEEVYASHQINGDYQWIEGDKTAGEILLQLAG